MKKSLSMIGLIVLLLVGLDIGVASVLTWADERGKLGSLVRYFEYGRSVPGKLARWETSPDSPGNLYDVAWRAASVSDSNVRFRENQAVSGPVVRSYGMSFVNNILKQAQEVELDLALDLHGGPGAPPNFTYALFFDDAQNRRPGDFAVFGILSSAVPALAALSNRTWAFEQPAPFTYPVFHLADDGLSRVEPLVNSANAERALSTQPDAQAAWTQQLEEEDFFYSPTTFGALWLDYSPFARLVRRSLAKSHIERIETKILSGAYPYDEVLRRMISSFAETARSDGQIPIVMLIQSRERGDVDVLAIAKPILERDNIPYLATVEHFDPQDISGFLGDGHYRPEIDRRFGAAFLDLIDSLKTRGGQ